MCHHFAAEMFRHQVLRPAHLALTFLTTLPLPHIPEIRDGDFARASGFYPLAGWVVGGLAALVQQFLDVPVTKYFLAKI